MDSLRSILPKVLRKRGLEGHATSTFIVYRAQGWLDEHLPKLCGSLRVETFAHAVLKISCSNGIAAQECRSLLPELQEHLHEQFPRLRLEEIQLQRSR